MRISHPKHQYDCLLGVLADRLGLYRPALVFAVSLGEVTNWSVNERILRWSDNLIRLFGLGLRWEYFDSYARGLDVPIPNHGDYTYVPEVKRRQVLGARIFFQDLLSLVTHDSLSEEDKRLYCMVARNLLTGIWARLGNRSYSNEGAYNSATSHVGKQIYAFGYQFDFERTPYMKEGVTGVVLSG